MNIFVNATSVRLGGDITVIRNLLPAMVRVDDERHRYTVVAREDVREALDPKHPRVDFVSSRFGGRSSLSRALWEQIGIPLRARFGSADVLLSPANLAVAATAVPQVMMFQNMAPFDSDVVSRMTPSKRRRLTILRQLGIASARRVQSVVFISDYAQKAIVPQLGIDVARTRRVYLGRDLAFSPSAGGPGSPLEGLGIQQPYLLCVSQFYAYKNFVELIVGFSRARRFLPENVALCIAGAEHEPDYAATVRYVIRREGLENRVHLLGHISYEKLPAVYAGASMFLFPSTCENFPNILVEAMASGVPTLASRLGPMPEIAGAGADYFDPFDADEIASLIGRYWSDRPARAALRESGIEQSRRYSWEQTAQNLLGILESAKHEHQHDLQ